MKSRRLRTSRLVTLVFALTAVMALVWGGMALYGREMQRRLDHEFDRALARNSSVLPVLARRGADLVHPPERGRFALLFASDSSQVELYLARGARLHGLDDAVWLPRSEAPLDMVEVPEELAHVLRAMPVALRTGTYWETLGETEYRLGHYGLAVRAFESALRAGRANPEAERGLGLAQNCARAVSTMRKADSTLPAYVQVRQLPGIESHRWVALSGTPDASQAPHFSLSNVKVALWSEGQPWHKVWQSASLRDPRFDGTDYNVARLYLSDLNADGNPEIIVVARLHGASWDPSGTFLFEAERNRLVHRLTMHADEVLFISPDDVGGRYTVSGDHAIGTELPHVGQPRWTDYYAWRGDRWRLVNADFPSRFDDLDREIRAALVDYPRDPELLIGAARIASYRKRPADARANYQAALKALNEIQASDEWSRVRLPELKRVTAAELHALSSAPNLH